jgi:hypothetical protein
MSNNPINKKSGGCATVLASCVIWQGPDLCCINLCTGDMVSDVVAKIAEKLCAVINVLNPKSYDISCITDTPCGVDNFQDLINFLIEQICELRNAESVINNTQTYNPDISTATCFQAEYGNVMSLLDYVSAIGVRLCNQQVQITTLTNGLSQASQRITQLEEQVNLLIGG